MGRVNNRFSDVHVPERKRAFLNVSPDGSLVLPAGIARRYGFGPGEPLCVDELDEGLFLHPPVTHLAKVYLEPTNECPFSCRTCMRLSWSEPLGRMDPATFSRVIEVDPRTSAIVWEYIDQSLFEFFSPYISGAQRLANGNTLICEGCHGRFFEVTTGGEVVWEYVNPFFCDEPGRPGVNNWVFRAFRYTPEEIAAARRV